jgi:hypothetical protein
METYRTSGVAMNVVPMVGLRTARPTPHTEIWRRVSPP